MIRIGHVPFSIISNTVSKSVVGTLSNVTNSREEASNDSLPSDGFASVTAAGSQTYRNGVSVKNILNGSRKIPETYKWYAMRVTYGREMEAEILVAQMGIQVYVPKRKKVKLIDGKRRKVVESLISNLLFIYTDEVHAKYLAANPLQPMSRRKDKAPVYIRFMYDHTSTNDQGVDRVIVIPRKEMVNFIRFTISGNEGIELVSPEQVKIKEGQTVIITKGDLKGVVGKVARKNRQTCVIVDLRPVCMLASAYIPKTFLEEYHDS